MIAEKYMYVRGFMLLLNYPTMKLAGESDLVSRHILTDNAFADEY